MISNVLGLLSTIFVWVGVWVWGAVFVFWLSNFIFFFLTFLSSVVLIVFQLLLKEISRWLGSNSMQFSVFSS